MGGDELELVRETFESNWIAPLGPQVDAFETRVRRGCRGGSCGGSVVRNRGAAPGARDAREWAPATRCCVPTLTFGASAIAITYVGATPVFVDSDTESWNARSGVGRRGARRGRQAGSVAEGGGLSSISTVRAPTGSRCSRRCERFGVPVIEDAAEALGATYNGQAGRRVRADRCVLVQRQQDHHHLGRRDAGVGRRGPGREGAVSGHPGARPGAALPALRDRLQLPDDQHPGCHRPRTAQGARGSGIGARRANFEHYHRELGDLPGVEFMPEAP